MRFIFSLLILMQTMNVFCQIDLAKVYDNGRAQLQNNQYSKAVKSFSTIINANPKEKDLLRFSYIWRAHAYQGLKKFKLGIVDMTKAIVLDKKDLASFLDRGKMYNEIGINEKALNDFEYVLSRDSTSNQAEAAYYYAAIVKYTFRDYKACISYCNKSLNLNKELYDVLFLKATAYSMSFKYKDAIKNYTKIIEKYPKYKEAYTNRAVCLMNMHKGIKENIPIKELDKICLDLNKALKLGDEKAKDLQIIYCSDKQN